MRRRVLEGVLAVVVLGGLAVVTAGCGSTDISAVSVDGHEVSQSSFNDELKALRDNTTFRQLADRSAAGGSTPEVSRYPNTVTSALSSIWATNVVLDQLVKTANAKRHVEVSAADRTDALAEARQSFGGKAAFAAFPKSFRETVVARQARLLALARSSGADLTTQEGSNALGAILANTAKQAHVTVDPRYGTWNRQQLRVMAPRAPGAPKVRTVNPNAGG